ncbi:MAG: hypothetical protein RUMPE_01170 [Eubacteriales bacterium SKADARSKE-1]|nr:hypothetical protein [Eubacteriales bacterium SKADARSKE-1]
MNINYIKARKDDADMLIKIYNASFYDDYVKYGECPAYGMSRESMKDAIAKSTKLIIFCEDIPIGVISVISKGNGEYYIGGLCVIPKYQGKGIGTQAIKFILDYYADWTKVTLITPVDKEQNVMFYTKKCGFKVVGTEMDGNVKVFRLLKEW